MEHVGAGDYGQTYDAARLARALAHLRTARRYLATVPFGFNSNAHDKFFSGDLPEARYIARDPGRNNRREVLVAEFHGTPYSRAGVVS